MYITGKKAKILKGMGKGKIGVITSCDAVGNVTILTEDGKEYGPIPDWGDYELLAEDKHCILLSMVSRCIGTGSRKGFEYAIRQSTENSIDIIMDDPKRISNAIKKLEKLGNFCSVCVMPPNQGGHIVCTHFQDHGRLI